MSARVQGIHFMSACVCPCPGLLPRGIYPGALILCQCVCLEGRDRACCVHVPCHPQGQCLIEIALHRLLADACACINEAAQSLESVGVLDIDLNLSLTLVPEHMTLGQLLGFSSPQFAHIK